MSDGSLHIAMLMYHWLC